jgi:hypothetical protein
MLSVNASFRNGIQVYLLQPTKLTWSRSMQLSRKTLGWIWRAEHRRFVLLLFVLSALVLFLQSQQPNAPPAWEPGTPTWNASTVYPPQVSTSPNVENDHAPIDLNLHEQQLVQAEKLLEKLNLKVDQVARRLIEMETQEKQRLERLEDVKQLASLAIARFEELQKLTPKEDEIQDFISHTVNALKEQVLQQTQKVAQESVDQTHGMVQEVEAQMKALLVKVQSQPSSRNDGEEAQLRSPDYALIAAGARVIYGLTSPTFSWASRNPVLSFFQLGRTYAHPPEAAFLPALSDPVTSMDPTAVVGRCWAMEGQTGYVTVRLSKPVTVSHVSVAHLARNVTVDFSSAPNEMRVYAVYDLPQPLGGHALAPGTTVPSDLSELPTLDSHDAANRIQGRGPFKIVLAEFNFDDPQIPSSSWLAQMTVAVRPSVKSFLQRRPTTHVAFAVLSNHGHPDHTCLYRLQVHSVPS